MTTDNTIYEDDKIQAEFDKFLQALTDGTLLDDLESRELSEEETREAMDYNELLDHASEVL